MELMEKYNVSVSPIVAEVIKRDMNNFNVRTRNKMYNMIIKSFYELYEDTRNDEIKNIITLLEGELKNKSKAESLAIKIIDAKRMYELNDESFLKKKKEVLPVKINNSTRKIVEKIMNSIDDGFDLIRGGVNLTISDYLRRLFTYYATMSSYKREMLLFSDKADDIKNAIENNKILNVTNNKTNVNFRFRPVAITTNATEQNAYVIGIVDDKQELFGDRYRILTMRLNKFEDYRIRTERNDIEFDEEYILEKYHEKVDENFEDILYRLNMIVELLRKFEFKYDNDSKNYVMSLHKMSGQDYAYYEEKYGYDDLEEIVIPLKYMDAVLSLPVKISLMIKHDSNFAYTTTENTLVRVKYTEEGREEYNKILFNRPETIVEENGNEVVYETTVMQAEIYFRRLKGAKIIDPVEINDDIIKWHSSVINDLS